MKKVVIIILISLMIEFLNGISYRECFEQSLEHSLMIKINDLNKEQRDVEYWNSKMNILPQPFISTKLTYDSNNNEYLNSTFGIEKNLSTIRNEYFNLQRLRTKASYYEERKKEIITNTALNVLVAYHSCLIIQKRMEISATDTLFWRNQTYIYKDSDNVSKYLYSKTNYWNSKIRYEDYRLSKEDAIRNLEQLIGDKLEDDNFVKPMHVDELFSLEELNFDRFYSDNYEIKSTHIAINQARISLYPEVYANGSYHHQKQKFYKDGDKMYDIQGNYIDKDNANDNWSLFIGVKYSLNQFINGFYSYKNNRIRKKIQRLELEDKQLKYNDELKHIQAQLASLATKIKFMKNKLIDAENLYNVSLISLENDNIEYTIFKEYRNLKNNTQNDLLVLECDYNALLLKYQIKKLR